MSNFNFLKGFLFVVSATSFTSSVEAFYGVVNSNYLFDNNIDRTKEDEKSDFLIVVAPKLGTQLPLGGSNLLSEYSTEYGRFVSRPEKDYLKQKIFVSFSSRKSAKYSLAGTAGYKTSLDVLGELGSNPQATAMPDLWKSNFYDTLVRYRTEVNDTIFELSLNGSGKYYDLKSSKIKDAKIQSFKFLNSYRLSGKTRMFYYVELETVKFQNKISLQFDSLNLDYVAGIKTKTTGKLDAIATVGWRSKKIKEAGAQRYGGFIANVEITWKKKSYSIYKLLLLRDTRTDPITGTTNIVSNLFDIAWQFTFTNRVITRLKFGALLNRFNSGFWDITRSIEPTVSYTYEKWLNISTSVKWSSKSSSLSVSEYNRMIIGVGLNMRYSK